MKNIFAGFSKVFSFTFTQQTRGKSYKTATIVLALLCFLLPALILSIVSATDRGEDAEVYTQSALPARAVLVNEGGFVYDLEKASALSGAALSEADSADEALAEADADTLVVILSRTKSETVLFAGQLDPGDGCAMRVILSDDSPLTKDDAGNFGHTLSYALFSLDSLTGSEIRIDEPAQIVSDEDAEYEEGDPYEGLRDILSYVLPYLNIMVLYFLILIYGQGVANSVIMEKTSKLMDSFLIAVRPPAMVLGKVLAICLAAIVQFAVWIVCLIAGFAAGGFLAGIVNPGSTTALTAKALFGSLSVFSAVFSIPGLIVGLLIILAGFLLYCSLAAIGGALAGKPEDLSSTNMLFTLALVVSFFLTLYSGGIGGSLAYTSWLNYFPFSAVLTVPGLAALGRIPIPNALLTLLILIVCALAIMYAAGKVYKSMVFYRGDPPKINKLFSILKAK